MEMKINFNKLFQSGDSNSHTPSTTSLQNSYQIEEPSYISSRSNHINLHYKFNEGLFFDSSIIQENDNINILNDISSIGRSYENSVEKSTGPKSPAKQKTKNNNRQSTGTGHDQIITDQFYTSQKNKKMPGQRLYYQSKINKERKERQIERLKIQIQELQNQQITFQPVLNQNSKKILQMAESPIRKANNLKKSNKKKQQQQLKVTKSYAERKQEQQLQQCTFHPTINDHKDLKHKFHGSSLLQERPGGKKVFEQLYNQHKMKQMRRKLALQEQQMTHKGRKMTKQQLQQFLQKNQQYIQQKQQKQQLLRQVSSQYDLTSGRKYFEPKVKLSSFNSTSTLFKNSQKNILSTPSPKIKQNPYQLSSQSPQGSNNRVNKGNSKSKKQRSNKKNGKNSKINSTGGKSGNLSSKTQNKGRSKDNKSKKSQHSSLYRAERYQVSKVSASQQQSNEIQRQRRKVDQLRSLQVPKSNLFTKLKIAESMEQNQEQYLGAYKKQEKQQNILRANKANDEFLEEKKDKKNQFGVDFGLEQNNKNKITLMDDEQYIDYQVHTKQMKQVKKDKQQKNNHNHAASYNDANNNQQYRNQHYQDNNFLMIDQQFHSLNQQQYHSMYNQQMDFQQQSQQQKGQKYGDENQKEYKQDNNSDKQDGVDKQNNQFHNDQDQVNDQSQNKDQTLKKQSINYHYDYDKQQQQKHQLSQQQQVKQINSSNNHIHYLQSNHQIHHQTNHHQNNHQINYETNHQANHQTNHQANDSVQKPYKNKLQKEINNNEKQQEQHQQQQQNLNHYQQQLKYQQQQELQGHYQQVKQNVGIDKQQHYNHSNAQQYHNADYQHQQSENSNYQPYNHLQSQSQNHQTNQQQLPNPIQSNQNLKQQHNLQAQQQNTSNSPSPRKNFSQIKLKSKNQPKLRNLFESENQLNQHKNTNHQVKSIYIDEEAQQNKIKPENMSKSIQNLNQLQPSGSFKSEKSSKKSYQHIWKQINDQEDQQEQNIKNHSHSVFNKQTQQSPEKQVQSPSKDQAKKPSINIASLLKGKKKKA